METVNDGSGYGSGTGSGDGDGSGTGDGDGYGDGSGDGSGSGSGGWIDPAIVYETHPSAPDLLCCHPDCRTELPTGGYHAAVCNIQLVIDELWSGPGDRQH